MNPNFLKASSLEDIIRYFDSQKPLTPENKDEWDAFYTETDRVEIERIIVEFLHSSRGHKLLFGGHSGNGKSTEINRLVNDSRINDKFFIVKFDVKEILNINDIEIVELFLVVCLKLLEFADQNKIKIESYLEKEFKKLEGFFQGTLKIESQSSSLIQTSMGVEGKISAKQDSPLSAWLPPFMPRCSASMNPAKS